MKKLLFVAAVILGIVFVVPVVLPMAETAFTTVTDDTTTAVLAVLPKFALGAAALGLLLLVPHWTRQHAKKIILYAFVAAAGAAVVSAGMAWVTSQSATVGPTTMTLAGDVIGKVIGGLRAGLG